MHSFDFYARSGFTRKTRKRKMRENIIRTAVKRHKMGLDTNIPFLKVAIRQQDLNVENLLTQILRHNEGKSIQNIGIISTARKEDGEAILEFKEGDVIDSRTISREQITRFNIFNAREGLQALQIRGHFSDLFRVFKNRPILFGDMRLSICGQNFMELEDGYFANVGGLYHPILNQIVVRDKSSDPVYLTLASIHELEHGFQYVLQSLCGYPTGILHEDWVLEYLSMIADLKARANFPFSILAPNGHRFSYAPCGLFLCSERPNVHDQHKKASNFFISRLQDCENMSLRSIQIASEVASSMHENRKNNSGFASFMLAIKFASKEYEDMYERFFGLSLEDIREIIANLPTI